MASSWENKDLCLIAVNKRWKFSSKNSWNRTLDTHFCNVHLLFSIVFMSEFEILFWLLQIFSSFFLIVIPLFEKNPHKNGSKQRSLRKVSRFSESYFAQKSSSCAIILYTIRLDSLKQKKWIDFPTDFSLVSTPNTLPKTLHDIPKNP